MEAEKVTSKPISPRLSLIHEISVLQKNLNNHRTWRDSVILVPTMGALHNGHLSLVREALNQGSTLVVVSIFVNPLQFGVGEDLDKYPRTLDDDLQKLGALAEELDLAELVVFVPSVEEMYPDGASQTTVHAGQVSTMFEGATRPGHFDGMLTVVLKLLNIVRPDGAVFGQKDAQQLHLIRQMVRDFNLRGDILAADIVREADGLALSSRNRYLSDDERALALTLNRALQAVAKSSAETVSERLAAGLELFKNQDGITLDYLVAVEPQTFMPLPDDYRGSAVILVAAKVGQTRLIDNLIQDFV
ncbi:MAG: pantoate--beta-alanine ligase [Microbacteriaceae bacterium]